MMWRGARPRKIQADHQATSCSTRRSIVPHPKQAYATYPLRCTSLRPGWKPNPTSSICETGTLIAGSVIPKRADPMVELGKFWASTRDHCSVSLIFNVKIVPCRHIDMASAGCLATGLLRDAAPFGL